MIAYYIIDAIVLVMVAKLLRAFLQIHVFRKIETTKGCMHVCMSRVRDSDE